MFFFLLLKVFAAKINATFLCTKNGDGNFKRSMFYSNNNICKRQMIACLLDFIVWKMCAWVVVWFWFVHHGFDKIYILRTAFSVGVARKNNPFHKFTATNGEQKNWARFHWKSNVKSWNRKRNYCPKIKSKLKVQFSLSISSSVYFWMRQFIFGSSCTISIVIMIYS